LKQKIKTYVILRCLQHEGEAIHVDEIIHEITQQYQIDTGVFNVAIEELIEDGIISRYYVDDEDCLYLQSQTAPNSVA